MNRYKMQDAKCKMQLEHSLLAEPLVVVEGHAKVPEKPGLGVGLDMDAVERYRVG